MNVRLVKRPRIHRLSNSLSKRQRFWGFEPRLDQSSTDSNLPISLGIPAITLGAGGTSGSSHTLAEWYDPTNRELGLKRGLLVILGLVGLDLIGSWTSEAGWTCKGMISIPLISTLVDRNRNRRRTGFARREALLSRDPQRVRITTRSLRHTS